jgi:hypothetical protein
MVAAHDYVGGAERNAGHQLKCPPLFHRDMTV